MTKFKQEVVDKMLTDPQLYAAIAEAKGVLPSSLGTVIKRNGSSINQYHIVALVADYLGKEPLEILETVKVVSE